MNNTTLKIATVAAIALTLTSCGSGSPRNRGTEDGKKACQCYKLDDPDAVEKCLSEIEQNNVEFKNDTAYTNAMEEQLLRCVADGIVDIVKPIKESSK